MKICMVGTSRCGTTLLRALIHLSPHISLFNETHWIPRMYEFFGSQPAPWSDILRIADKTTWHTGKDLLTVNTTYSNYNSKDDMMQVLIEELQSREMLTIQEFSEVLANVLFDNPASWGDKTPDYGYYMGLINHLWPKCKFLHIVRDGLAASRSMHKHSGCQFMISGGYDNWCSLSYDNVFEKYSIQDLPVRSTIESWCRRMRRIRNESLRLPKNCYLEVEYESILDDPSKTLGVIEDFCNFPLDISQDDIAKIGIKKSNLLPASELAIELPLLNVEDLHLINQGWSSRYFRTFNSFEEMRWAIKDCTEKFYSNRLKDIDDLVSILAAPQTINRKPLLARTVKLLILFYQRKNKPQEVSRLIEIYQARLAGHDLGNISSHHQQATHHPKYINLKPLHKKEFHHEKYEVVVYSCIRNELLRLPYFLEYYRKLGVNKFVFIDNDSTDGGNDFLLNQEDCSVFWTNQSYAESSCGVDWLNYLLNIYSIDRWALIVDADELLIYPHCEVTNIHGLVTYLTSLNATALGTFLLDMYADGPIRDVHYNSGESFINVFPYFDKDSYAYPKNKYQGLPCTGGVRKRLFWAKDGNRGNPPVLRKFPLIKWGTWCSLKASTHNLPNATLSHATGVLLHFKFFADFYTQAELESIRGEHWDEGAQYEAYWNTFRETPNLNPMYENSVKYRNSTQLVELGLMSDAPLNPDNQAENIIKEPQINHGAGKHYCIKPGYTHNLSAISFDDSEEDSAVYQLDVYSFARNQIREQKLASVVDIGCGCGLKLQKFILPECKTIVGIDWQHAITYCSENHNFGEWHIDNVENSTLNLQQKFDCIICSDVIEHLIDPDKLFPYMRQLAHKDTLIVLSTPERDLRRGKDCMGPPKNRAHVREWNKIEFKNYLLSQNISILSHDIVDLKEGMQTCQMVLCKAPNNKHNKWTRGRSWTTPLLKMKQKVMAWTL